MLVLLIPLLAFRSHCVRYICKRLGLYTVRTAAFIDRALVMPVLDT